MSTRSQGLNAPRLSDLASDAGAGVEVYTGNLPPHQGIYPNYMAPVIVNGTAGRELDLMSWGMPTPPVYLSRTGREEPQTNIRNLKSAHWRRWLGVASRCLVPFTSFAVPEKLPTGRSQNAWFAMDEVRPLYCFPGVYVRGWTSIRKVKDGPTTDDLFEFLTTEPNAEVRLYHPRAMPVIFRTKEECDAWMTLPLKEAVEFQRPLPDGILQILARGTRTDGLAQEQARPAALL